jgi:hypothetical protein
MLIKGDNMIAIVGDTYWKALWGVLSSADVIPNLKEK